MRAAFGRSAAWTCVMVLAATGAGLAQVQTHFEDDFNRDAWTNAQTNTVFPPWSTPGGSFSPPTNATPIQVQINVTGTQFQVLVNGQVYYTQDDPDLQPGSVGLHSWAQRNVGGQPFWGLRSESLSVLDASSAVLLDESWQMPAPVPTTWAYLATPQANGTAPNMLNVQGNFRWDFTRGVILDDTNSNTGATGGSKTDFYGAQIGYTGAGANNWTNYLFRTRLFTSDNDGLGVIFRYFEDANTLSFYRVTFSAEANTAGTRPVQGISIQKVIYDKNANTAQWTSLYQDPVPPGLDATHIYTPGTPFDVAVQVENLSASETKIDLTMTPQGGSPVVISVTDNNNPIQSGSIGFHNWGSEPVRWSSYGGVSTPIVETLDAQPQVLLADFFSPGYNDWQSTYQSGQAVGNPAGWGIHLTTLDVMEASDGRQADGVTTANVADGKFTPFILYKSGFNSGANYTYRTTLKSNDDDGFGVVFGYVDQDNYFRVSLRAQTPGNLGFPPNIAVQKVVGGTITQLAWIAAKPTRANQAGIWIKKFASGTIEMSDNANIYDGVNTVGVEYQGPRLVAGDTGWTDYTYETVIETNDNDGIGILFRYQNESNYYRLMFQSEAQATPGAPPAGLALHRVVNGVYTELLRDTDPTQSGDNDADPLAGFIYDPLESATGYKIWRPRVILTGGTIRIEIDAILIDGTEFPNYYVATVVDPAPLTNGKIGLHTWGHNANEFRDIKVTLAGQSEPVFEDGTGQEDPKGWADVSMSMADPGNVLGEDAGSAGTAAGTPISGIGLRPDLDALGVRDNRWIVGTFIEPGNNARGTKDWDGPRAIMATYDWFDFTYQVDLRTFDNDGIGILFRYVDEQNFYRLAFLTEAANANGGPPRGVSVQKRLGGSYDELFWSGNGGDNFLFTPGERWRVELTAEGPNFTVKVTQLDGDVDGDGKTEYNFAFADPADPFLSGRIGVTAWGSKGQADESNTLLGLPAPGLNWTQNFSEGAVWDNVVVDGTAITHKTPPDLDGDGEINGDDLILWGPCAEMSGPEIPLVNPSPVCKKADVDLDGDIDQDDWAYFQLCYSGEGIPLDPTCVQ